MKPVELFGVVVRSVGLMVALLGMGVVFWALMNLLLGGPGSAIGLLLVGGPPMFIGIWLLLGASRLAEAVYREDSKKDG